MSRNPVILPEETPPERNPTVVPTPARKRLACPVCHKSHFTGMFLNGTVERECLECGNKWQGGLPMTQEDPRQPMPPAEYTPPETYSCRMRNEGGRLIAVDDTVHVERRAIDPRPDFRRGIPLFDEEDGEL